MADSKSDPEEIVIRLPNIGKAIRSLLPPEAADHFRAAQREQMLALKEDRAPGYKSRGIVDEVNRDINTCMLHHYA